MLQQSAPPPTPRKAFTLIELLVVIAIIAILSVVVILTLNPAQLLQQSRDSNRISDMGTLNTALGIYLAQGGSSLGSSSVVYVSIPDPSATTTAGDQCQGLGLISLPSTYSYHCAASSTFRDVNGQGWIPVNFTSLPAGSPLGSLPTDPTNTSSSREYYTYDTNGSQYEVTMVPESQKYQLGGSNDVIASDGGTLASVYEKGNAYGLEPLDYGDPTLVGWWNFSEGTGTVAYDYSGNNATGSWSGTQIGTNGYYTTNAKIGGYAGDFDGTSTYVNLGNDSILSPTNAQTISVWFDASSGNQGVPIGLTDPHNLLSVGSNYVSTYWLTSGDFPVGYQFEVFPTGFNSNGGWNCLVMTYSSATGNASLYLNGILIGTDYYGGTISVPNSNSVTIGARNGGTNLFFSGLISDVRIYNRALSSAQIAAMYAGGK